MFSRFSLAVSSLGSVRRLTSLSNSVRSHSTNESTSKDAKKTPTKNRTPMGKLDENAHPDAEKQPLKRWPDNVNPVTGEINGPSGPEPTRYGDWERKGKCVDF